MNEEYEYSFKVKDIKPFIEYCINNSYILEDEYEQTRILYKNGGKITFSSDSHEIKTLQGCFDEVRAMVKEIGFQYIYIFQKGEWAKKII